MRSKEEDISAVKALKHGEHCAIAWSEESGGMVYRLNDDLFLFEVGLYGGDEIYDLHFHVRNVDLLVDYARSTYV